VPPVASVWTNDKGEKIKFEAGTVGQWVDLTDPEFKVRSCCKRELLPIRRIRYP
jgi:hypothetical protein